MLDILNQGFSYFTTFLDTNLDYLLSFFFSFLPNASTAGNIHNLLVNWCLSLDNNIFSSWVYWSPLHSFIDYTLQIFVIGAAIRIGRFAISVTHDLVDSIPIIG